MARLNNAEFSRSNESPMDYQYDNVSGPVSSDSPFLQGAAAQTKYNTWGGQKRSASVLDSPTKPSIPGLRPPEGQTFYFSQMPQLRNPSFTTPQKPIDTDFSSGLDQSSPANADAEDTPDQPPRIARSKASGSVFEGGKSEKKPSSPSIFSRLSGSGRGEKMLRPFQRSRKIDKRRKRTRDSDVFTARRRSSEDSESPERPGSSDNSPSVEQIGFIPSVLSFIDAHPNLPSTLSYYVQFLLNCFFAFCLMYVLYGVYSTISNDIDEKVMMESSEIFAEMAACAHEFQANRCDRQTRVPAMETVCNNWEKCMNRDPMKVGRSRLSAGMFAEIFNSFIEPISLKAIIVSVSVIVGCFAVNNFTFGLLRLKHDHQHHPHHLQTPYLHPPHQPQIGYPHFNDHYFASPYQNHIGAQGVRQGESQGEAQSPSKKLEYR